MENLLPPFDPDRARAEALARERRKRLNQRDDLNASLEIVDVATAKVLAEKFRAAPRLSGKAEHLLLSHHAQRDEDESKHHPISQDVIASAEVFKPPTSLYGGKLGLSPLMLAFRARKHSPRGSIQGFDIDQTEPEELSANNFIHKRTPRPSHILCDSAPSGRKKHAPSHFSPRDTAGDATTGGGGGEREGAESKAHQAGCLPQQQQHSQSSQQPVQILNASTTTPCTVFTKSNRMYLKEIQPQQRFLPNFSIGQLATFVISPRLSSGSWAPTVGPNVRAPVSETCFQYNVLVMNRLVKGNIHLQLVDASGTVCLLNTLRAGASYSFKIVPNYPWLLSFEQQESNRNHSNATTIDPSEVLMVLHPPKGKLRPSQFVHMTWNHTTRAVTLTNDARIPKRLSSHNVPTYTLEVM